MTPPFTSALFPGNVTHARFKPKIHKLAYRIYSLLLDLDELETLDRKLRFFPWTGSTSSLFIAGTVATAARLACAGR